MTENSQNEPLAQQPICRRAAAVFIKPFLALAMGVLLTVATSAQGVKANDAPFQIVHLGTLPANIAQSAALSVSADGAVVVGYSHTDSGDRAVRWQADAIQAVEGFPSDASFSIAHGVSADGSVIIGQCQVGGVLRAFRWQGGAVALLESRPDESADAWAVSADGRTIVGSIRSQGADRPVGWLDGKPFELAAGENGAAYAISADGRTSAGNWQRGERIGAAQFRNGELQDLGGLRRGGGTATAWGISADGKTIVGECESPFGTEAFRWTAGRLDGLGCLSPSHDFLSSARAVSADGSVIVGSSQRDDGSMAAFAWDAEHGLRWIEDILVRAGNQRLGLWTLREATGISADGRTIVGIARDPRGRIEAWLARVPAGVWRNDPAREEGTQSDGPIAFGAFQRELRDCAAPGGAALDERRIYVSDPVHDRISVFDHDGRTLAEWRGSGRRHIRQPQGLACGSGGELFVADTGNRRICVLDSNGKTLRKFSGEGAHVLVTPVAVAVDEEHVYVADAGRSAVAIFDRSGKYLRQIDHLDAELERLRGPRDVAVSPTGQVFIADTDNDRIVACDRDGGHCKAWGGHGEQPGFFVQPTGVRFFRDQVLVVDRGNQRVQMFTPEGEFVSAWGPRALRPHAGQGRLHLPEQMAISAAGDRALLTEPLEDRCQLFSLTTSAPEFDPALPVFDAVHDFNPWGGVACAGAFVAVPLADRGGVAIFRLTNDNATLVTRIGAAGGAFGQFRGPTQVVLDGDGARLTALDTGNRRLQTFSISPAVLSAQVEQLGGWRFCQALDLARFQPANMAAHFGMRLQVSDSISAQSFEIDFDPLRDQIEPSRMIPHISSVDGLAFDRAGDRAYVMDASARRILAFDRRGRRVAEWNGAGPESEGLVAPSGIAVDRDNAVYVTDAATNRVQKFDSSGHLLAAWGQAGIGAGEFCHPAGVAIAGDGRVVVVDVGNHRCQVFSPDGKFRGVLGSELYSFPARLP